MVPHKESIKEAIQVTLVDLHIRKGLPVADEVQRRAEDCVYAVTVLMGFGIAGDGAGHLQADAGAL